MKNKIFTRYSLLVTLFLILVLCLSSASFAAKKKKVASKAKPKIVAKKIIKTEIITPVIIPAPAISIVQPTKAGLIEVGGVLNMNSGANTTGAVVFYNFNDQIRIQGICYFVGNQTSYTGALQYTLGGDNTMSYYVGAGASLTNTVYFALGGIRYYIDPKISVIGEVHVHSSGSSSINLGANYAL